MNQSNVVPMLIKHQLSMHHALFSANDLWRIGGRNENRRPGEWIRRGETQELIFAIAWKRGLFDYLPEDENDSRGVNLRLQKIPGVIEVVHGGKNSGIWLCEDLAIAYAMWINAKFQLLVIECFKEYGQALISRRNLKGLHKDVTDALLEARRQQGKETKAHHYSNEARMINDIVVGMPHKVWMQINGYEDDNFREVLSPDQLTRLERLEHIDEMLIGDGLDYGQRKAKLEQYNERMVSKESRR